MWAQIGAADFFRAAFLPEGENADGLILQTGAPPQVSIGDVTVPIGKDHIKTLTSEGFLSARQIEEFASDLMTILQEEPQYRQAIDSGRAFSTEFEFRTGLFLRATFEPTKDGLKATIARVPGG